MNWALKLPFNLLSFLSQELSSDSISNEGFFDVWSQDVEKILNELE